MIKVFFLILSVSSYGALPALDFKNVEGAYDSQKGSAYAMYAKYKIDSVLLTHTDINVTFNMDKKNLVLQGPNTEVHFGFDFSFLNIFQSASFFGVDIFLNKEEFVTTAPSLEANIGDYNYSIKNVDFYAKMLEKAPSDELDHILDSFISRGHIKVNKVKYKVSSKKIIKNDLLSDEVDLTKIKFNKNFSSIRATLKNLDLTVNDGKVKGRVYIDSWINAWLRFNGKIRNMKKSKSVEIELNYAKLGIFKVKKFVLRALRKLESDKIKVKGNIITIILS
ncbi:MAG: hypothetical protein N4A33_13055 [Bacteriovoracaceae bacterium]|nr:hypothetical protein [Bacteriovoracaceae bacterium]